MENRKYILVIKRNNNDYLPLEWQHTQFYNGEDLSTIEGIDSFTKRIVEVDLLISLTDLNLISYNEQFQSFTIIFQEKGRLRELKEGPIFANYPFYEEYDFIDYILRNISNKRLINRIYNLCSSLNETNIQLEKFKLALNNLDMLANHNPKAPQIALNIFNELPYEIKRKILVRFSNKVLPDYQKEMKRETIHRKVPEYEDKIA